jgi:hypothetical protein
MLTKFVLNGHFQADSFGSLDSPLDVYIDEHSLSVGRQFLIGGNRLVISPFAGGMFIDMFHPETSEISENEYSIKISGTNIGGYESGGGKDGDFKVFKLKEAEIRGNFSESGLKITITAKTLPGEEICYSAKLRRKNAYAAISVDVGLHVPPESLPNFLSLPNVLSFNAFSHFSWYKP